MKIMKVRCYSNVNSYMLYSKKEDVNLLYITAASARLAMFPKARDWIHS